MVLRASPKKEKEFYMNGAELREYELVYALQPAMDDVGITNFEKRVADVISSQGGQDIVTEPWGKRTLAYPIKRYYEAYYILQRFAMPPTGADEVERTLRFSEDVVRYLLIRADE